EVLILLGGCAAADGDCRTRTNGDGQKSPAEASAKAESAKPLECHISGPVPGSAVALESAGRWASEAAARSHVTRLGAEAAEAAVVVPSSAHPGTRDTSWRRRPGSRSSGSDGVVRIRRGTDSRQAGTPAPRPPGDRRSRRPGRTPTATSAPAVRAG